MHHRLPRHSHHSDASSISSNEIATLTHGIESPHEAPPARSLPSDTTASVCPSTDSRHCDASGDSDTSSGSSYTSNPSSATSVPQLSEAGSISSNEVATLAHGTTIIQRRNQARKSPQPLPSERVQTNLAGYFIGPSGPKQPSRRPARKFVVRPAPKRKVQMTLARVVAAVDNNEEYGDLMVIPKPKQVFRLLCKNINRISLQAHQEKSKEVEKQINILEPDALAMQELGINWDKASVQDQMYNRLMKVPHARAFLANNTTEFTDTSEQYGGVGIVTTTEATHRVVGNSRDPRHLGRWVSVLLNGRATHKVRIVSVYNPTRSDAYTNAPVWDLQGNKRKCTKKLYTVYNQHLRYLRAHGILDKDPLEVLRDDLKIAITSWLEDQEDLVICLDANEDVRSGPLTTMLRQLGLQDIILTKHMPGGPPPATQAMNQQDKPIDAIFTTMDPSAVKCGYSAFGEGLPGDHRTLWVDFPFTTIFGNNPPNLNRVYAPRLNVQDPRVVKKYCKEVTHAYQDNGVAELGRKLREETANKDVELAQETHQILEPLVYRLRMEVGSCIRKKKMGAIPWSPEMQKHFDARNLWTLVVKKKKRVRMSTRKIRRLMKKCFNKDAFDIDLATAQQRRNNAHKAFVEAKKKAPNMRKSHLQGLAEALARKNKTDPEKEKQNLRHKEKQRDQARRVRRLKKKFRSGLVTKLFQTVDGVRTALDTKQAMELGCEQENESRFTKSHPTAFLMQPLLAALGILADGEAADAILAGTYEIPEELDKYTKLLLIAMKRPDHVPVVGSATLYLSGKELKESWKKQRSTTASEQTALSYCHHIAGVHNALIAEIDAALLSAPYELGFSPLAWEVITDVELLKKFGVYDVEQMRAIQLMVAAFNMNNKRLGRQMMRHAEKHHMMAKEQYGSRKRHKAIDAGLNKVLTADICRQQRRAAALLSNDAEQCYDRMNHAPTSLAMRRVGMLEEPIRAMFDTLQRARHHVSTAYGVALTWYGGLKRASAGLLPLMGIGQGNGAGPAAYAALSSVFVKVLETAGFGALLISALSLTVLRFVCYIFVDDADIVITAKEVEESGEDIVPVMQEAADHWEGVLRSTGGSISAPKSFWYLMDYSWTGTKWVYRTIADMPGEISIRVADGTRAILQRYDPDHAERTLGIFPAMDGNPLRQIEHLTEKVKDFAQKIRVCRKKEKNDVWVAMTTSIMKTLEYPMRATCIGKNQWDKIMSPLLQACLPAAGFARNFPHTVIYGPTSHQGLGLLHPWYHQELHHLDVFWEEISNETLTGDLLQVSLEELRLELGLPGYLTAAPYTKMDRCATSCWLKTLWESSNLLGLELEDPFTQLRLSRVDDEFLMMAFLLAGFTTAELKILNECRTFLHVVTLADITSASGTRILQSAYEGKHHDQGAHSYSWPRQPDSLSTDHWQLWQQALDKCFILMNSPRRTLVTRLKEWTVDPNQHWVWWYHETTSTLYQRKEEGFEVFRTVGRSYRNFQTTNAQVDTLPIGCKPASAAVITQGIFQMITHSNDEILDPATIPTSEIRISPHVTCDIPFADAWAVEELLMSDAGAMVAEAIKDGHAIAVSDGSFKELFGTSSFTLQGNTAKHKITGRNAVPGAPLDQSAYRSELSGIAGIVVTLSILCSYHNITGGGIEIGLDGEQAMKSVFDEDDPDPSDTDYDLIYDLRAKIKCLPIVVRGRWVEGHQDKQKRGAPIDTYDRWALLNMEMDEAAKDFWHLAHLTLRPNQRFGNERVVVKLDGNKLSCLKKATIYQEVYGRFYKSASNHDTPTKLHWQKREGLSDDSLTHIHWHALGMAFRGMPFGKKRWLTKHASGHCSVGHMAIRRKHQDHSHCPRCDREDETTKHVVQCQDARAAACWAAEVTRVHQWMESVNTEPTLHASILKRLAAWRSGRPLPPLHGLSPPVAAAIAEQDAIGWWNFLLGRVSARFADVQAAHYLSIESQRGGRTWLTALIREVADLSFAMWEHRNNVLHNTMTPKDQAELATLRQLIKDEFAKGLATLLQQDQHWLQEKDLLLKMTLSETRLWLATMDGARAAHRAQVALLQDRHRPAREFMERWLARAAPP